MTGKYIESDTFLMPLIPCSDRKAQLVKETIRRHSFHGADGVGTSVGVMERGRERGETHTHTHTQRRGQGFDSTKNIKAEKSHQHHE